MIQDFGRDLVVGAFRGYRWWRLLPGGHLQSPWYGRATWDADANEAICLVTNRPRRWLRRHPPLDHTSGIPVAGCDCGFYALHDVPREANRLEQQVFPWQTNPHMSGTGELVFGIAEAWGRVLIGTHGWRAQYTRAVAVYLPRAVTFHREGDRERRGIPEQERLAISLRYGIPVVEDLAQLREGWGPTSNPADDMSSRRPRGAA